MPSIFQWFYFSESSIQSLFWSSPAIFKWVEFPFCIDDGVCTHDYFLPSALWGKTYWDAAVPCEFEWISICNDLLDMYMCKTWKRHVKISVLPNCEHRSSIPPSQATSFPFGMIQNVGYTSIYEPFSCCLTVYLYILMFSPTPKMYNWITWSNPIR